MKKFLLTFFISLVFFLFPKGVFADNPSYINLKTNFNIWKINLGNTYWIKDYSKISWNGIDIKLYEGVEENLSQEASSYLSQNSTKGLDFTEVKDYLVKKIAPSINRQKQDVTIDLDENGKVKFEGFAMSGQEIDYEKSFFAIRKAYMEGITDVRLPIKIISPIVTVKNEELKNKGIKDLLATGETNFAGSPSNRRNNIKVGLNSFNGHLVAPNAESGAGAVLGRIDASTGYLPELVIKGDQTIPEYGGGLCQVSTTVYRSLLFAGLPITQRRNHSYAVSYYDPQGLDATIYPPSVDMKFKNDTSGYILLQTTTVGNKAYSNVYGTPVDRYVDLIGPYYYDYVGVPPPRTEYTDKLPPGKKQSVGGAHTGFKASWYRRIIYNNQVKADVIEHIYSNYQARPLYTLIGAPANSNSSPATQANENGT